MQNTRFATGCAVWARTADPSRLEDLFKRLIDGVKRPGIEIRTEQDKTVATPVGAARSLVYMISPPGSEGSFVFTMLTAEHSGGAFQASLQVALAKGTGG